MWLSDSLVYTLVWDLWVNWEFSAVDPELETDYFRLEINNTSKAHDNSKIFGVIYKDLPETIISLIWLVTSEGRSNMLTMTTLTS